MKKYLIYHQSSEYCYWDYYKEKGYKYDRGQPRLNLVFCGLCSKNKMINILSENKVANKNWIRERIGEFANKRIKFLVDGNPNWILVLNGDTNEIIAKYPTDTPTPAA